jgi:hypothetical protein
VRRSPNPRDTLLPECKQRGTEFSEITHKPHIVTCKTNGMGEGRDIGGLGEVSQRRELEGVRLGAQAISDVTRRRSSRKNQ